MNASIWTIVPEKKSTKMGKDGKLIEPLSASCNQNSRKILNILGLFAIKKLSKHFVQEQITRVLIIQNFVIWRCKFMKTIQKIELFCRNNARQINER